MLGMNECLLKRWLFNCVKKSSARKPQIERKIIVKKERHDGFDSKEGRGVLFHDISQKSSSWV